ncbi:hypothetical protein C0V77_10020 [Emticicia sp. TH156]|nr:hypothetical protein C0V77_10020 [Emticicia sp. TH156]
MLSIIAELFVGKNKENLFAEGIAGFAESEKIIEVLVYRVPLNKKFLPGKYQSSNIEILT